MPQEDIRVERIQAAAARETEELKKKSLDYYIRAVSSENYTNGLLLGILVGIATTGLGVLMGHCTGLKRCPRT